MKYGKLTIQSTFKKKRNPSGYRTFAVCSCDCGKEKTVDIDNLKSGHTKSCGCHKVESATKHGLSGHQLYKVWEGIVTRCNSHKDYGLRGITMCQEWRESPKAFIEWSIANGWVSGLTIERVNVNGNYEPSNCTFIPFALQAKNTRKAFKIELDGVTDTKRGWAKRMGIHHATLNYRLSKGMELREALK